MTATTTTTTATRRTCSSGATRASGSKALSRVVGEEKRAGDANFIGYGSSGAFGTAAKKTVEARKRLKLKVSAPIDGGVRKKSPERVQERAGDAVVVGKKKKQTGEEETNGLWICGQEQLRDVEQGKVEECYAGMARMTKLELPKASLSSLPGPAADANSTTFGATLTATAASSAPQSKSPQRPTLHAILNRCPPTVSADTLKKIRKVIDFQFDLEVYLKQREIALIQVELERGRILKGELEGLLGGEYGGVAGGRQRLGEEEAGEGAEMLSNTAVGATTTLGAFQQGSRAKLRPKSGRTKQRRLGLVPSLDLPLNNLSTPERVNNTHNTDPPTCSTSTVSTKAATTATPPPPSASASFSSKQQQSKSHTPSRQQHHAPHYDTGRRQQQQQHTCPMQPNLTTCQRTASVNGTLYVRCLDNALFRMECPMCQRGLQNPFENLDMFMAHCYDVHSIHFQTCADAIRLCSIPVKEWTLPRGSLPLDLQVLPASPPSLTPIPPPSTTPQLPPPCVQSEQDSFQRHNGCGSVKGAAHQDTAHRGQRYPGVSAPGPTSLIESSRVQPVHTYSRPTTTRATKMMTMAGTGDGALQERFASTLQEHPVPRCSRDPGSASGAQVKGRQSSVPPDGGGGDDEGGTEKGEVDERACGSLWESQLASGGKRTSWTPGMATTRTVTATTITTPEHAVESAALEQTLPRPMKPRIRVRPIPEQRTPGVGFRVLDALSRGSSPDPHGPSGPSSVVLYSDQSAVDAVRGVLPPVLASPTIRPVSGYVAGGGDGQVDDDDDMGKEEHVANAAESLNAVIALHVESMRRKKREAVAASASAAVSRAGLAKCKGQEKSRDKKGGKNSAMLEDSVESRHRGRGAGGSCPQGMSDHQNHSCSEDGDHHHQNDEDDGDDDYPHHDHHHHGMGSVPMLKETSQTGSRKILPVSHGMHVKTREGVVNSGGLKGGRQKVTATGKADGDVASDTAATCNTTSSATTTTNTTTKVTNTAPLGTSVTPGTDTGRSRCPTHKSPSAVSGVAELPYQNPVDDCDALAVASSANSGAGAPPPLAAASLQNHHDHTHSQDQVVLPEEALFHEPLSLGHLLDLTQYLQMDIDLGTGSCNDDATAPASVSGGDYLGFAEFRDTAGGEMLRQYDNGVGAAGSGLGSAYGFGSPMVVTRHERLLEDESHHYHDDQHLHGPKTHETQAPSAPTSATSPTIPNARRSDIFTEGAFGLAHDTVSSFFGTDTPFTAEQERALSTWFGGGSTCTNAGPTTSSTTVNTSTTTVGATVGTVAVPGSHERVDTGEGCVPNMDAAPVVQLPTAQVGAMMVDSGGVSF